MKTIAMIPARLGSQRLKKKNLEKINGISLLGYAVQRAEKANCFDEIWINSESDILGDEGIAHGAQFHKRPERLANNQATSEDFVYEFLEQHPCDLLVQVHSIAPLLSAEEISEFTKNFLQSDFDVYLSAIYEQIECAMDGQPINFDFTQKTNSQELVPIQRITWAITGWRREVYMKAYQEKKCATYYGKVGFFPVNRISGHVVKTREDLDIINALSKLR